MFTEEFAYAGGEDDPRAEQPPGARDPAVLIVEDERVARRALSALLSANGYATEAAESAEEALSLLKNHPAPRVALVDLNLPGMSGLDFIRHLVRLNPATVPVLMTAATEETLAAALHEHEHHHPFACLRKPLDFQRLLTVISQREPGH